MAKIILLVEDKKNVRESLADVLEKMGYTVEQAANAKEALKKLSKPKKLDLVVSDVGMSKMDGYEMCRQIKQVKKLPVKVIIYTGTFNRVDPVKAKRAEADDFVVKGTDPLELLKAIKKIL